MDSYHPPSYHMPRLLCGAVPTLARMEPGPVAEEGGEPTGRSVAAVAVTPAQRERRRRIVRAALELLTEHTYDSIQIRDVALRADVALGTLYRYFPSKEQLFANVMLEWASRFDEVVRRRRPESADDAERLRALLRRAVRAFERNSNFVQLHAVLGASPDPAVGEAFSAYSDGFAAVLAEAVPDTDPSDVEVLVTLSNSLLDSLLRTWWLGRLPLRSVEEQVDRAVDVMFSGVSRR